VSHNLHRKYLQRPWLADVVAMLLLALTVLLFFWPVIWNQAWIPKGGGDSVSFIYPMYRFAAQSLWSGTIPLWNPYQYAGSSFIGDNQSGIFYPFNLILFLLNPGFTYRAIEGLVLWHFFFAGAAMYFCLRFLRPDEHVWRPAALIGGLAFMLSGLFITHIGNLNLIAVASWLPLAFLALHRAIISSAISKQVGWAVAGGAALGVATLAGHGQMTFLLAAFLGSYALFRAVADRSLWPLLLLGVLALTAVALAAINLFPSFEAVKFTVRAGFDSEQATNYSLPWPGLLGLFAPDFFGRGTEHFWGGWSRVEYGYVGVLTLFMAGLALIIRRSRLTLFFALSVLLFLLLALGENAPLYPFLLQSVPFFPFQVPARFVLLLDFSLAALAAIGMDSFDRRPRLMRSFLIGSAILVLVVLAALLWQYRENINQVPHHQDQMLRSILLFVLFATLSWLLILARGKGWLSSRAFAISAVLLLAVDLIALGYWIEIERNDPMPGFAEGSAALEYIKSDPGLHRIDIAGRVWQPNLPQMEGLYSIRGVYNPLALSNYTAYIGSVGYRGSTLYNLLGVKYVIGGKEEPPADTTFIVPVYDEDPDVTVFLNTLALPRANVVYNATVLPSAEAVFDAIHEEDFDPLMELIIEEGKALKQERGDSTITVLRYDTNRAAFEVSTDKPAYLLLSDMYHPHWKAAVDGIETPILQADYALRAVPLDAGTHLVEMWYAPPGWTIGAVVSGLALLLLAPLVIFWLWQRRKFQQNR
jgi:uncharacterized membrane protein YfhO